MAGQCPQPRGDGTARHALSRRPRLRSSQARRRRSIAAARYLFAVASGMEIRMPSSPSPRRWLFVLPILDGNLLLLSLVPMVVLMVMPNMGGAPAVGALAGGRVGKEGGR